ncbi:MAG: FtsX-like permease family protein [Leucobacter sp.]
MTSKRSLYLRHALGDLKSNRAVAVALTVVLILSAFLMATGAMVMERLTGSVDRLFEEAKPPHFLQMHVGDYDPDALEHFAAEHPEIDAWVIEEMLGFDGAAISWRTAAGSAAPADEVGDSGDSGDLADSLIDNLFVTQNAEFDLLLDETGAAADPEPGEVYVPIATQQRLGLSSGDELAVRTDAGSHTFEVAGSVRDAQMTSSMSSATRFLVSVEDFERLRSAGGAAPEIAVEYRLADPALTSDFQRAYESDASLPKNGQAVTGQMIRIINAFSDGLLAIALMFVSLLLIAIALLNVRFVIRGTLEDEVREIGTMKAIGIPTRTITGLYLAKYSVMTLVACLIGGALAVAAASALTRGIRLSYAAATPTPATVLVPLCALVLVYLIVMLVCRGVLASVARMEVVGALVHGSTLDARRTARQSRRARRNLRTRHTRSSGSATSSGSTARSSIASVRSGALNSRLALLDLRAEWRQWLLLPAVYLLAAVLITLPLNLLTTFDSPRFVTYMGAPQSALRADVRFSDDADAVHGEMLGEMRRDDRLANVRSFAGTIYETVGEDGWESLRVETGDYAENTIRFLEGAAPEEGEIALSALNAEKYGASVGDEMRLRAPNRAETGVTVTVSGVYQDVTSGGFTAKMRGDSQSPSPGAPTGYVIYADLSPDPAAEAGGDAQVAAATVAAHYGERFPSAAVIPMQRYVEQTLSHIVDAFRGAAVLSLAFAVGVAVLITVLFLRLRLGRDRHEMGTLSAVGFSVREIVAQIRGKALVAIVAGTALGTVLAATAGERAVGAVISLAGLGIERLEFIPDPWLAYAVYPVLLAGAGYLATVLLTARLHGADRSQWLK